MAIGFARTIEKPHHGTVRLQDDDQFKCARNETRSCAYFRTHKGNNIIS